MADLRVYESMLDMLSNADNPTPMVRLNRVVPFAHTKVYAKLEWYNPFGSVKDRIAANLVRTSENDGLLEEGQKLVEPTSGNTGLGLAMMANAAGYQLTTPLSNAIPLEKRTMLRFFGAVVEELEDDLCPAPWAPEGAIARANEIADQPDVHMFNQYANEANPQAHYQTTGPEVWRQTGEAVTHFVAGLGTCGTITGTGRFLREQDDSIQVIGVHPHDGHDIPGVRSLRQLEQTEFFKPDEYNGLVEIKNQDAYDLCLRLNREESIPAGPSSGMALAGALQSIPDEPGNIVVVIFPDGAFKYASSFVKHIPGLGGAAAPDAKSPSEELLDSMVENARVNPHLTVEIDEARRMADAGATIVDVRDEAMYSALHVQSAVNFPLLDLPDLISQLPEDKDAPILAVCNRGNQSLTGVLYLHSLGYHNARSMNGGTIGWVAAGLATE